MKKVFALLFVAFMASSAIAETITATQAQSLAGNFLSTNSKKARGGSANLSLVYTDQTNSQVNYYAFNATSGEGFVIVAGDDQFPAILGYSDEGSFDANDIPENMKAWLDEYAEQIKFLQANPSWKASSTAATSHAGNIYPLLGEIKWNQSSPYNLLCPTYVSSGTTKTAVTGCVATAMAQVMGYHKWPETGTGSSSYVCSVNSDTTQKVTLTANYGNTTYDWGNMLPIYTGSETTVQKNAVATLMSHCGISVEMGYGASSGAVTRRVMCALGDYFKYDKGMRWLSRAAYTLENWSELLDKELTAGRPVVYSGSNATGGGHAFVIDGSNSSGYYHLNWGWAGSSNGYFALIDLSPKEQGIGSSDGGYNNNQGMIIGIQADKGNEMAYSTFINTFDCDATTAKKGASVSVTWKSYVIASPQSESTVWIGLGIYDQNGNFKQAVGTAYSKFLPKYNYSGTRKFNMPTLSAGTYYVRPVYSAAGYSTFDWKPMDVALTTNQYLIFTVDASGTATITKSGYNPTLKVDTIEVQNSVLEASKSVLVKATLTNTGTEYFGNALVGFVDANGKTQALSAAKKIDVAAGGTSTFEMTLTAPAAGNYKLKIFNSDTVAIAGTAVPVTVTTATGNFSLSIAKALSMPSTNVPSTHLEARATLTNQGGTFNGQIECMILYESSNTIISRIYSDYITIGAGETKLVKFNAQFTGGQVGNKYRIVLRNPAYPSSNTSWGSKLTFTLVDPVHGDVNCDGSVDVSDITTLINAIFGTTSYPYDQNEADANGDGTVDVSDVTTLMSKIL